MLDAQEAHTIEGLPVARARRQLRMFLCDGFYRMFVL